MQSKHSRRYNLLKNMMPKKKVFISEGLEFLLKDTSIKQQIKISITLHWNSKRTITKKINLSLPESIGLENKIMVIKDGFLESDIDALSKEDKVVLLSVEELKLLINKKNRISKTKLVSITKIFAHQSIEKTIQSLNSCITLRGILPSKKNNCLVDNILIEVEKFNPENQVIKTDKNGNIHLILGNNKLTKEQMINNYKTLNKAILDLRPHNWKGLFIKKITISSLMGPGIHISF